MHPHKCLIQRHVSFSAGVLPGQQKGRNGERWGGFGEKGQWPSTHPQTAPCSSSWNKKQDSGVGLCLTSPLLGPCIFIVSITPWPGFKPAGLKWRRGEAISKFGKNINFLVTLEIKNSAAGRGKLTKDQELIRVGLLWFPHRLIYLGTHFPVENAALFTARPHRVLACEAFSPFRVLRLACLWWPSFLLKLSLCGCFVHSPEAFKTELLTSSAPEARETVL